MTSIEGHLTDIEARSADIKIQMTIIETNLANSEMNLTNLKTTLRYIVIHPANINAKPIPRSFYCASVNLKLRPRLVVEVGYESEVNGLFSTLSKKTRNWNRSLNW